MKAMMRWFGFFWCCITLQSCSEKSWEYELVYTIKGLKGWGTVWLALPVSVNGRQHMESRHYSLQPVRYLTQNGDSAAEFRLLGDGRPLQMPEFAGHRWLAVRSASPIQSQLTDKL